MITSRDPVRVDGSGTEPGPRRVSRILAAAAVVFGFWLAVSASLAPADLVLGLLLSLFLGAWSVRFLWEGEAPRLSAREVAALLRRMPGFGFQVLLAALHVARVVLDPGLPIRPRLVTCRTNLRRPLSRVVFAQAVTLTPGTLTVAMQGGVFLLHCLDLESAQRILDGSLEREVAAIFEPAVAP